MTLFVQYKIRLTLHLVQLLLLLSGATQTWATSYFISLRGQDANPGTRQQPWRTIRKVNSIVLRPGDQLLFSGGEVFKGNLLLHQQSQSASSRPIVVGSYGSGRATIRVVGGSGVVIRNLEGIVIQDLRVTSDNLAANQGYGVQVINDRPGNPPLVFVCIQRVEVSGFRWAGIYVGGVPTDLPGVKAPAGSRFGFRDVRIADCVAHHNMYYGIYVSGAWTGTSNDYGNAKVRITGCTAHDNAGDATYTANHSGSGIMLDDTDEGIIEYCVAYRNGALNAGVTGGPCGIWTHASNRVVMQHCEAYGNRTGGAADGGGFDLDGGVTNAVVQYCYSHDNDGPGFLVWNYEGAPHQLAHNTIRYNISSRDGRQHQYGGIHIGTSGLPVIDLQVYHNTIYVPAAIEGKPCGIWTGGSMPNEHVHFYNNLIVTTGSVPLVVAASHQLDIRFAGNAYWQTGGEFQFRFDGKEYADLAAFRTATGQETERGQPVGLFTDPKVVLTELPETIGRAEQLSHLNAYRLRPDSPLYGAGVALSPEKRSSAAYDFWRNPLRAGQKPTIGADQGRK